MAQDNQQSKFERKKTVQLTGQKIIDAERTDDGQISNMFQSFSICG